jgi:hypothetical protein
MIAHQAICVAKPVVTFNNTTQRIKKSVVILLIKKNHIPGIATRGDMIDSSWKLNPDWSCHNLLLISV